jgi:hypothetical protein
MATIEPMRSPPPEYSAHQAIKPAPQDIKPAPPTVKNTNGLDEIKVDETKPVQRESSESLSPAPIPTSERINADSDDEDAVEVKLEDDKVKVEEHKRKYDEEEKKLRGLEPPPAQTLQEE